MDDRERTPDMMRASLSVHVPDMIRGNKKPLKKAAGLYVAFRSASNRCTFSFLVSWISSRTLSSMTDSRNLRTT